MSTGRTHPPEDKKITADYLFYVATAPTATFLAIVFQTIFVPFGLNSSFYSCVKTKESPFGLPLVELSVITPRMWHL